MFAEQAERKEQNHLQQQQIKKPVMGTALEPDTSGTFSGTIDKDFPLKGLANHCLLT